MTSRWDEARIARRLPLWIALADLFLDTDAMLQVPNVARTIVEGGYDLADAETALRWEVRPAFYFNLLDIAGEWAGWHPDFVRERIIEVAARGWKHRLVVGRRRFMPDRAWRAVVAEVERLRTLG
ncbi:hypothetical protein JMG10_09655 [Nostoc ellipsosporum NOK]|nr:hypothetical protein [Nostoc ellipsosporum NOK]